MIPEEVRLRGTLRTLDAGVRAETVDHIERLANSVAQVSDTQIDVDYGLSSPSVNNHPDLIALLMRSSEDVVGRGGQQVIARPSMGSEDFAFYLQKTPGAMLRLGCRSDERGGAPLHSQEFDVDEEVLRVGARVMAGAAIEWWSPRRERDRLSLLRRDATGT